MVPLLGKLVVLFTLIVPCGKVNPFEAGVIKVEEPLDHITTCFPIIADVNGIDALVVKVAPKADVDPSLPAARTEAPSKKPAGTLVPFGGMAPGTITIALGEVVKFALPVAPFKLNVLVPVTVTSQPPFALVLP
jgi:hypothetical protein